MDEYDFEDYLSNKYVPYKEWWDDYKDNYTSLKSKPKYAACKAKQTKKTQVKETEDMANDSLFRIVGTDNFGKVLATDSKGKKVFEIKGGGIEVVDAKQIEEVFPFTFAVTFNGEQEYEFLGQEDQFKVGNILVYNGGKYNMGVCRVTKLNTKSRSATKTFDGYKLEATAIKND